MNDLANKINKAKKKLKKLQKRQRKQDMQGVSSFDTFIAESNELIKNLGDVWATAIKDIYGKEYRVSAVDDVINEPVITESLDISERPIVCDDGLKPRIIDTMTMKEFIKFRDKMARLV